MNVSNGTTSIINRNRTRNILMQTSQIATFIYSKKQLGRLWAVKPPNYYFQLNTRTSITTVIIPRRTAVSAVQLTNLLGVCHLPALCFPGSIPKTGQTQAPARRQSKIHPTSPLMILSPPLITAEIIPNKICAPCSSLIYLIDFSILVYPAMSE